MKNEKEKEEEGEAKEEVKRRRKKWGKEELSGLVGISYPTLTSNLHHRLRI